MFKKSILFILSLILVFSLVACSGNNKNETDNAKKTEEKSETKTEEKKEEDKEDTQDKKDEAKPETGGDKKKVAVTTSFIDDMVKVLAGDHVERLLIIPAGEDPHLYVAKPEDLGKVQNADLVLYHGLHFEGKMAEILGKVGKSLTEDFTEEDTGTMEENGQSIIDPHFWFDIDLYKRAVTKAAENLKELLPENADEIQSNLEAYLVELDKLDQENREQLSEIPEESRYLVTPHDAFNYFARRYDIKVMAPQGVSTESEVANKDLEDTAQLIADKKIKAIFAETTTDPARMEKLKEIVKSKGFDVKVISGHDQELFSDSLAPIGEPGDSYIDMYKHNVMLIHDNLK